MEDCKQLSFTLKFHGYGNSKGMCWYDCCAMCTTLAGLDVVHMSVAYRLSPPSTPLPNPQPYDANPPFTCNGSLRPIWAHIAKRLLGCPSDEEHPHHQEHTQ